MEKTKLKSEINSRISRLQKKLTEKDIDAALIFQNADLLYFTGTLQQGALIIPSEGEPVYLVKKSFERALKESPLKNIRQMNGMKDILSGIKEGGIDAPKKIGLELDVIPSAFYLSLKNLLKSSEITDASIHIRRIRSIKSAFEINIIRKACSLIGELYSGVREFLKTGIRDIDFASEVESAARKLGHQGVVRMRKFNGEVFFGHVFSGSDAAEQSFLDSPTGGLGLSPASGQGAGYKVIAENEPVIVDFGFAYNGYIADCTRLFCVGKLDKKLEKAYKTALLIQGEMSKRAKAGILSESLYNLAFEIARKEGFKDYFMGSNGNQVSFVGHGIGLELDEFPFLAKGFNEPLEENMVFAFEPKFVFSGKGVVGIENMWLVKAHGVEKLTKCTEKTL